MKILIVVAAEKELEAVMAAVSPPEVVEKFPGLETLLTGPGMFATAYWLGKTLAVSKPDLAINTGIAGSYNKCLPPGTVVAVTSDRFADFGANAADTFLDAFETGLYHEDDFPFTHGLLQPDFPCPWLPHAQAITVNTAQGDAAGIRQMEDLYHPDIETMEGAAFIYACRMERIPCMQVRSISNFVEPRNREAWNIPLALESLASQLNFVLRNLEAR